MDITREQFATLAYFDQFDFPLTKQELDAWQLSANALPPDVVVGDYDHKDGMYFLHGKEDIVTTRKERYIIADKKFKRALRFAKIFRLLPSVRMIAICNTLGFSNARIDSDIDFFIITKPGTIWLTRFWLQSLLRLFRLRPHDHGVSIQDALCLSFFTDSDTLDFEHLQITTPDIYLAFWLSHLVVVYDPDDLYTTLWGRNAWVKKILPYIEPYRVVPQRSIGRNRLSWLFSWMSFLRWEKVLRQFQKKLMPATIHKQANTDSRVVITDHMLKFHSNDRRKKIYTQWLQTLKKLNS